MIIQNEYYTFNELKQAFNWTTSVHDIQRQIIFARKRNVIIQPGYKKGSTYFKVLQIKKEEEPLKPILNKCYTFEELKKIFDWPTNEKEIEKQITFARVRHVLIQPAYKEGCTYFKLLNFKKEQLNCQWVSHPFLKNIQCCKEGFVRNANNHRIYDTITPDGYIRFRTTDGKTHHAHRLIMETFKPIENSKNYVVDHINGIRSDNRLNNLRWVFQKENMQFKDKNQTVIKQLLGQIIQKIGYQQTVKKLQQILK